jgi:Zn-dependent peptidase ImmA (M78 family)
MNSLARAVRAAGEFLLAEGVSEFPVDAKKLLGARGVKVLSFESTRGRRKQALSELLEIVGARDAITLRDRGGRFTVMYSGSCLSEERIGFTLAHELAHIVLGHEGALAVEEKAVSREESEADAFARELLMPAAALSLLPKPLSEETRLIFRLSRAAWSIRLQKATGRLRARS